MLKTVSGHRKEAIFNNGRKICAGNALCKICYFTINSIINSFDFWGLWTQIWNQQSLLNGAKSGHKIEMYTSFNLNTISNFVSSVKSRGIHLDKLRFINLVLFLLWFLSFLKKMLKFRYCEKATYIFWKKNPTFSVFKTKWDIFLPNFCVHVWFFIFCF